MLDNLNKINDLKSELKRLENEHSKERTEVVNQLTKKLDKLIMSTPTSELRNELTEINILVLLLIETLN